MALPRAQPAMALPRAQPAMALPRAQPAMALTRAQTVGWGLADLGIGVFVVVKQLLVFAFLTTFLGVPAAAAGWVTFAVLAFDVVTDPLVGYLSDRTRSRWGRRTPWIATGAVLLVAGIIGIFAGPEGWGWQANAAWVLGFFALATVGFTFVAIPYGAMAGEMTQDPRERSAMTAWRMTFASLGLLLAGAVLPAIAGTSRAGYMSAVLVVAPVVLLAIWAMLWFTRHAPRIEAPALGSPGRIARLVLSNRPFVVLVVLYGLMTLAVALISAGLQLAALYLVASGGRLGGLAAAVGPFSLLFACFVLGAVLSQWPWVRASVAIGKVGALAIGVALYVLVLVAIYAILPGASLGAVALVFVAAGACNGAYQQIPWAMYPDLMDRTRAETGAAVEGAFSALWLFGQKVPNALAPLILGLVLEAAGWRASADGAVAQDPGALSTLLVALTLLPAALLAASLVGLLTVYRRSLAPRASPA